MNCIGLKMKLSKPMCRLRSQAFQALQPLLLSVFLINLLALPPGALRFRLRVATTCLAFASSRTTT